MRQPEFILYTGPMFASKTTKLLSTLDRFKRKNLEVVAFKPSADIRFSVAHIMTHNGASIQAQSLQDGMDLEHFLATKLRQGHLIDVIGVDEAFMIPNIGRVLVDWYRKGTTIVVSSIQMSAALEPFPEIAHIMPWATHIEVCSSICGECDQDAYLTASRFEFIERANTPQLGGAELYSPLCHQHFTKLRERKNV
jgi:thymidine kinase